MSASYTWSKNVDYLSRNTFGGPGTLNNPFDFFYSPGVSDYNRTHRFVNSFVWDLPGLNNNSAANAILGGWRLSGVLTLQSGRPFHIGASNNATAGAGSARADLIGSGGNPVLDTGRSKGEILEAYFDTSRFANPEPNSFGNLGRNSIVGPGYGNFDMSLTKGWPLRFLTESTRIEYRFEAFNLLNATHLNNPTTGLTNPNFGKITGTSGDPRILQMALKLQW